ncbi:TonB-dependent receptor [Flammeovirga sp. SubArs3]|uniref:SusC/RagA family TonB-linked outer membrane protein n=1 Tax=Flammeovirga sp. SubArs3 TaxID=2995316 RepID=UPI00248BB59B|nr:TonB-dependent receptor [Flammeovirga sp. SubArs3]
MMKRIIQIANFLILFILTFFITNVANAQDITVKGIVHDPKGITIPGASVSVVNELKGTISDIDGKFTVSNVKVGDIILISFIGYEKYTFTVKESMKPEIKVYLKESVSELDEVVVIGYGEQKKEDLTGAISRVSGKDIERSTNASFENELQGRMAGVRVVSNSGQPGASSSVSIRGVNSIGGNNRPLYVIDGVPIISDDNMGFAQNEGSGQSAMADINPADIKSVEVLKDASSTAIYGSMGSNGVILITTKQGEAGDIKTNVSGKYGVQELPKWMYKDVLDTPGYMSLRAETNRLSSTDSLNYLGNTSDTLTNTNWQDQLYRQGYVADINASVSGGTRKFNFRTSANYYKSEGIIENSGFERITFNANVNGQVSEKLRMSSTIYIANSDAQQVNTGTGFDPSKGQGSVVLQGLRAQPTLDLEGNNLINNSLALFNNTPLDMVRLNSMQNLTNVLVGNLSLDYNIGKGFALTTRYGVNNGNRENNFYRATNPANRIDDIDGWAKRRFSSFSSWNWDNQIRYNKKINKFNVNALLMSSLRSSQDNWSSQEAQNFPSDALKWYNMGAGTSQLSNNSGYGKRTLMSFTARAILSYDNRYFLTVSERIDGASQFSKNNKWASFPAVSASWKINQEKFFSVRNVDLLKLRASYGTNGSPASRIGQSLAIYSTHYGVLGSETKYRSPALREAFFTNDELKWELTKELNFGLDFSFYKSRITFTGDYYIKNTDDLLLNTNVPGYTGFKEGLVNVGSLQNKGLELMLKTTNVESGDFSWSSSIMYTNAKTYITDLNVDKLNTGYQNPWINEGATQRLIIGKELGTFWGRKQEGVFQYEDFKEFRGMTTEEAARKYREDLKEAKYQVGGLNGKYTPWKEKDVGQARYPGQPKYKDLNGDGKINSEDLTEIGNAQPDFVWSLGNDFTYKNLTLSIFIVGEQGRQMANLNNWQLSFLNGSHNTTQEIFDNRWTPENPTEDTHIALASNNQSTISFSDDFIEDASFIRLKRVDLMYRFVREKFNANLTFSVSDIYTWTNYSGYNPDVSLGGHNALKMGHDYGIYPLPITYNVGLNLTFK